MDLSAESGTLPTHSTAGRPVLERELSVSNARCQTESGGTILLKLLEFKSQLLEAVEELHIRRDAETRFEDQISKLVLEKQELEWEKESLQHQIETAANQHAESLINVKKQLQAKIRNTEEEKGKYQVSAELKDKEINNLKEELKTLQLLKYNLEKKSSELEQKLALQSRSKDSHLNQLGEVEKRFSALSRQCAMVKQAHEKLEQNVDEAMKIKKKLTAANEKQEATIVSLKKELEEVSKKLIKAKMSSVRHDKTHSPTGREQQGQQLHQKLIMETEMNKTLREENAAVRAEKQEVMRSLQHTQQLLLSQTQTVSRVELELQTQREQYQALKQEHRVMREKSTAMEDKVAQLMESYAASKNSWNKEKEKLLDCIKSEQQDLKAAKEVYDELHKEHTELSSQAKVQAQHIYALEMRDSSESIRVSTEVFRGEETVDEPITSSELPSSGSLQHLASTLTRNPDCLEDTAAVTKLAATGATGVSVESSPGHRSNNGSGDLLTIEKSDEGNGGMSEKEQGWEDDAKQVKNNREEREINKEQQWNREEVQVEGGSAGEKRGTVAAQTTERADRREDSQGSTEDAGDPKQPGRETQDRAEERGKTGLHTAETQIPAQTTADTTTGKSDTQQVNDFMDTEPPLAACEPTDSQSLSQKVSEKDADSSGGFEIRGEVHNFCSEEQQRANHEPNSVIQEVERPCHDEAQTTDENPSAANIPTKLPGPLNQSSLCGSQTNTAPVAALLDDTVGVQDMEATATQRQPSNPSDITSDMKQNDEKCDTHVNEECVLVRTTVEPQELPQSQEISKQGGQLMSLVTDDDCSAYKKREGQSNVDTQENDACESTLEPVEKSDVKDACADITMDAVDLDSQVETSSSQEHTESDKIEDAGDAKTTKTDPKVSFHSSHESGASAETGSTKCDQQSTAKKKLLDDTNESSLLSNKTYGSSFDWGSAHRKPVISRNKSDASILHQFVQGSPMFEQSASGPSTIPMFLKGKHNKVPLVITRASDLLNASSVSGTAASTRRHPQGEWTALGETSRETVTADKESRASFPVSTSIKASRLSWQTTPGCSRAPTSAAAPSSGSDLELSFSQEREDQQSSFRAQISKIEQFLNAERLRLPKRGRTDN